MVIDFSTLYDLPREMEKFFDASYLPSYYSRRGSRYPQLNIWEDDENYYIDASLPGVEGKDIDLTLTDKSLTIKGKRVPEEGNYYRQERVSGLFQRVVNLAAPIDRDQVAAKYVNGVLSVALPKAEAVKPRKIAVEA